MHTLEKGKKYNFTIRFRLASNSSKLNLHIKESGTKKNQIIYSYNNALGDDKEKWNEITIDFVPNSSSYDEFMIGAAQITGEHRFFEIDYIYIK